MIFSATVVGSLCGEQVGRYRIHLAGRRAAAPPDADFINEARCLFQMRGLSREDMERLDLEIVDRSFPA